MPRGRRDARIPFAVDATVVLPDPDFRYRSNPGCTSPLRRARLLGQLLEHRAQRPGRAHALREWQAERCALELQLEAFGVAADAAPGAIGCAEEPGRIEAAGVGVIGIHVRQDVGLG